MTRIQIKDRRMEIEVLGWHKLWSFKSRFDIPLSHVVSIRRFEKADWTGGLRSPGTYLPGVIRAGSYYAEKKWSFWDACKMDNAIVIELRDEKYAALFVETASPAEDITMIRARIA